MLRAKRPLAEADSNVSRLPRTAKRGKIEASLPVESRESNNNNGKSGSKEWGRYLFGDKSEREGKKEQFEYMTKDNSKLRRFLLERDLPTRGTRDEMITRLVQPSISYEDLPSEQLTEMLKWRHLTNSATGSKAIKMERLGLNDKIQRDTGTSADNMLYAHFSVLQSIVPETENTVAGDEYSSKTPKVINTMLTKRKLSTFGTRSAQIARLQKDDRERLNNLGRTMIK